MNELRDRFRGIAFCKVIFPFWPESLPVILERTHPLLDDDNQVDYHTLESVEVDDYFVRRLRPSERWPRSEESSWAQEYIKAFYRDSKGSFLVFLNNLSGSSVRIRNSLISATLMNPRLVARYAALEGFSDIGMYDLFDAVIKGRYVAHNRLNSKIANLFLVIEDGWDERSVLLGNHVLDILAVSQNDVLDRNQIVRTLEAIGHDPTQAMHTLDYFYQKNIISYRQTDGKSFVIRRHAVKAHFDLLTKSSYLENMAIVSPVSPSVAAKMENVEPEAWELVPRKKNVLKFLEFIRLCEDAYKHMLNKLSPAKRAEAVAIIQKVPIRGVFERLGLQYKRNLESEVGYPSLSKYRAEIGNLLKDKIFDHLKKPDTLFPKGL